MSGSRRRRRWWWAAAVVVFALIVVFANTQHAYSPAAPANPTPVFPATSRTMPSDATTGAGPSVAASAPTSTVRDSAQAALTLLSTIPVKGRAPATGYDSSGTFWGFWTTPTGVATTCDTRNYILGRDLTGVTFKAVSPKDCVIETGTLADPYTGQTIQFVRATCPNNDGCVQIDHVVARKDAWQTGAFSWTPAQRQAFANDPLELLAVSSAANMQKGDGDAATWLPSSKPFRCTYVALQTQIKAKYGLWMTSAEHDAVSSILAGC